VTEEMLDAITRVSEQIASLHTSLVAAEDSRRAMASPPPSSFDNLPLGSDAKSLGSDTTVTHIRDPNTGFCTRICIGAQVPAARISPRHAQPSNAGHILGPLPRPVKPFVRTKRANGAVNWEEEAPGWVDPNMEGVNNIADDDDDDGE